MERAVTRSAILLVLVIMPVVVAVSAAATTAVPLSYAQSRPHVTLLADPWRITASSSCNAAPPVCAKLGIPVGTVTIAAMLGVNGTGTATVHTVSNTTHITEVDSITGWRIGAGHSYLPQLSNDTFWITGGTNTTSVNHGPPTVSNITSFDTHIPAIDVRVTITLLTGVPPVGYSLSLMVVNLTPTTTSTTSSSSSLSTTNTTSSSIVSNSTTTTTT